MTTNASRSEERKSVGAGGNWLAVLVIPVLLFGACLAADLWASDRLTSDIGRGPLLFLLAAVMQLLVILSLVPWWSATLLDRTAFGGLIAALRMAAMTVSATVVLFVLALLQDHGAFGAMLKVQVVVLGVGLFLAGAAAVLRALLRSTAASGTVTMLLGYLALASPFWGNVLVQSAGGAWKSWAVALVVALTPLSACSSAVGYDLFRGRMLYKLSVVSDFRHSLPAWWLYALVAAILGIVLLEVARLLSRRAPGK